MKSGPTAHERTSEPEYQAKKEIASGHSRKDLRKRTGVEVMGQLSNPGLTEKLCKALA